MNKREGVPLILIRHTQTHDNVDRIYSSQLDVPLNATGLTQAIRLADDLAQKKIVGIYTSDLRRTRLIAELIGVHHRQVPVYPDARLRELNMGRLSGLVKGKVLAAYPDARLSTKHPEYDFSSVGGESRADVLIRHRSLLQEICQRYAGSDGYVVLVGHGTSLRDVLQDVQPGASLHAQGAWSEILLTETSGRDKT